MALSRVYLRAHWLSDTVAGALLGAGLALGWPALLMALRAPPGRRRTDPLTPCRAAGAVEQWRGSHRAGGTGHADRPRARRHRSAPRRSGMTQLASGPARTRPAKRSSGRKPAARKAAADNRAEPGPSEPGKDESPAGRAAQSENEAAEAVMGLDMVLVDAARGPLRRLVPPAGTALRFGSALARQPAHGGRPGRRAGPRGREDRRGQLGAGPEQEGQAVRRPGVVAATALLRRAMQLHLATARTAWELIEDADLDWQDDERIRFTATNLVDALAPSNVPVRQPAVAEGGDRHRRAERRRAA